MEKSIAPSPLIAIAAFCAVVSLASCTSKDSRQMELALDTVILGDTPLEILRATSDVAQLLSDDARERLTVVRFEYIAAYGEEGMADRLRGKTVRKIIDDFTPTGVEPLDSGVTSGVE